MVAEEGYDGFLRAELDRLFESLVRQHQAEAGRQGVSGFFGGE